MEPSWESLKAKAKALQGELDTKLQELGRLNRRLGTATEKGSDGQIQVVVALRDELERGLADLSDAGEALARVAATSAQVAQATRFRETHQELARDFKRVSQSIEHQYQHARLIPKGRSSNAEDSIEQGLMRERNALSATLSMTDEVISQATSTHTMLQGQRVTLQSTSGKVGSLTAMFPGLDSLISQIGDRKNKENMVLASTIAGCIIFTMWYKLS
mmetsp:Transcript_122890/g.192907  ORF Transcript_122890/g.192907 Transcript_122890/m.192907 type:complete len:217 (+) Transcript_122890:45-695(+)